MKGKRGVLFLCTHNSARSQIAEALLRRYAGDRFEVISAGLEPSEVHPLTRRVLAELGVDAAGLRAKGLKELFGRISVKYAIVVCLLDEASCPRVYPFATNVLHWPFEDPARGPVSAGEQLQQFRRVRDQIDARIRAWLREI